MVLMMLCVLILFFEMCIKKSSEWLEIICVYHGIKKQHTFLSINISLFRGVYSPDVINYMIPHRWRGQYVKTFHARKTYWLVIFSKVLFIGRIRWLPLWLVLYTCDRLFFSHVSLVRMFLCYIKRSNTLRSWSLY